LPPIKVDFLKHVPLLKETMALEASYLLRKP
jgi:hypothetical protein